MLFQNRVVHMVRMVYGHAYVAPRLDNRCFWSDFNWKACLHTTLLLSDNYLISLVFHFLHLFFRTMEFSQQFKLKYDQIENVQEICNFGRKKTSKIFLKYLFSHCDVWEIVSENVTNSFRFNSVYWVHCGVLSMNNEAASCCANVVIWFIYFKDLFTVTNFLSFFIHTCMECNKYSSIVYIYFASCLT